MNITHRRVQMPTLKGDLVEVKIPRFIRARIVIANIRLRLAKVIVPHSHAVVDEADVSHYLYLKDLVREQKVKGND